MAAQKLLDLPPEILGHIFSFIRDHDHSKRTLGKVRLSCRTLSQAVFGYWSERWLRNKTCDVYRQQDLLNLRKILATEHLSKTIKKAHLHMHHDSIQLLHQPLLNRVVEDLAKLSIPLHVQCSGEDFLEKDNNKYSLALAHSLFAGLLDSGCKVESLDLDTSSAIDPYVLEAPDCVPLSVLARNLISIKFTMDLEGYVDVSAAALDHDGMRKLFGEAHSLKELELCKRDGSGLNERDNADLGSDLIRDLSFTALTSLALYSASFHATDFAALLRQVAPTLEEFQVIQSSLYCEEPCWHLILQQLQCCKRLKHLRLSRGYRANTEVIEDEDGEDHGFRIKVYGAESCDSALYSDRFICDWSTLVDVQAALVVNIDKRSTYGLLMASSPA